jgi:hypothetical protein
MIAVVMAVRAIGGGAVCALVVALSYRRRRR